MRVTFEPAGPSRPPHFSDSRPSRPKLRLCALTAWPPVRHTATGALLLATLCLAACGTQPPRDFRGSWKPVNRFGDHPTEIPLDRPYAYYAAPMDETLRSMLERWAKDTGRALDYQLDYDVTLYKPVAGIHTPDLAEAADRLSSIYAAQGVRVVGQPRRILVQPASAPAAPAAPSGGARP